VNPRNDLREVAQGKDRRKSGGLPNKKFEVLHQNQNNTEYQDYSRTELALFRTLRLRRRARKIARASKTLICTYTLIYYFYLSQL
jgi:hypothetical protein